MRHHRMVSITPTRAFKAVGFAKAARKAGITDKALLTGGDWIEICRETAAPVFAS